jgi:hypothetical protein
VARGGSRHEFKLAMADGEAYAQLLRSLRGEVEAGGLRRGEARELQKKRPRAAASRARKRPRRGSR